MRLLPEFGERGVRRVEGRQCRKPKEPYRVAIRASAKSRMRVLQHPVADTPAEVSCRGRSLLLSINR